MQSIVGEHSASYPDPLRGGGERAWYRTYCTRMRWDLHSDWSCYHSDRLRVLHDMHFYGR
jgi:hypothetical protein